MEMARQEDVRSLTQALPEANLNPVIAGPEGADRLLYRKNRPAPVVTVANGLENIHFYARVDPLEANYQAQRVRCGSNNFWFPPKSRDEYTRRSGTLFLWTGDVMTDIGTNDPVGRCLNQTYSAATISTQNPDTPHLLVVPFNAQMTHPATMEAGSHLPSIMFRLATQHVSILWYQLQVIGQTSLLLARITGCPNVYLQSMIIDLGVRGYKQD